MTDRKTLLLDHATRLAQTRGYNGFSFHDLAQAVGIKTASIHYHFPTKADLGRCIVERYTARFMETLGPPGPDAHDALARYAALFRATLAEDRMCLCGMLGSEIAGLPESLGTAVQGFFAANTDWLEAVVGTAGVPQPRAEAQLFLATLEGALLVARVSNDPQGFDAVVDLAIKRLGLAPA